MKETLRQALLGALAEAQAAGELPPAQAPDFVIENPKQAEHGDLAANLALLLAKPCRMKPRDIAQALAARLGGAGGLVERAEVAGPGFINVFINPNAWRAVLPAVLAGGADYGRGRWGAGQKVQVEFVSANPTGPLHVGHGRGAVLGDTLARLLDFAGFAVGTEYYINDAGNQMNTLGRSVLVRARQLRGSGEELPEAHYMGEYIRELAAELLEAPEGQGLLELPEDEAVRRAAAWAGARILDGIRGDLAAFGVSIASWYSERALVERGAVGEAFAALKERDLLYEAEGALWFASTGLGDDKDRVVRRSNGETTYFASDIAYHLDKFRRGFDRVIDVWGADHHGYVPRLKAAMAGLGRQPDDLTVVLVQLVNLLRGGEPAAMSTRSGEFVTLREVIDEVGADSARFLFLTRRSDAQLDFDLEVAKAKSMDNPVFYVQYAHTRVMSVLKKAEANGVAAPDPSDTDLGPLSLDREMEMCRKLAAFGETAAGAAQALEPHRVVYYLQDLAGLFHSYYNEHRVLGGDQALTAARLVLVMAVGQVLRNGLSLLGVSAPEAM